MPAGTPSAASAAASMSPAAPRASATSAGPTSASSGMRSIPGAPSMKWQGASTWVPVWVPSSIRLTFARSPAAIRVAGSIATAGSPSKVTIPVRSGRLTSIQATRE